MSRSSEPVKRKFSESPHLHQHPQRRFVGDAQLQEPKNRPVASRNWPVGTSNHPVVPRNRPVEPRNPSVAQRNGPVASVNRPVGQRNAPVVYRNRPIVLKNRHVGAINRAVGYINATFSMPYDFYCPGKFSINCGSPRNSISSPSALTQYGSPSSKVTEN